jgi:hypothetical protein
MKKGFGAVSYGNFDSDVSLEQAITALVAETPLASTSTMTLRLQGAQSFPPFCVVAQGLDANGFVRAETLSPKCSDNSGGNIIFAGKFVDVEVVCKAAYGCGALPSPDAGADAGADAGVVADAGVDAGASGWQCAMRIDGVAGKAYDPQIAVDSNGNIVAVWSQHDGTYNSIFANRYVADAGRWGDAGFVDSNGYVAFYPQVALDANGNAIVVWEQWVLSDTVYHGFGNRYDADAGVWGSVVRIERMPGQTQASGMQVAFDTHGDAIAVWYQDDGTRFNVYSNRFSADAGRWGDAGEIETGTGGVNYPRVAVDSNGNAVAVWMQYDGTYSSIYANRFSVATGLWGDAGVIEQNAGNAWYYAFVAVDSSGNAVAVWRQDGGTAENIWANRYNVDAGLWGDAGIIQTGGASACTPNVAASSLGVFSAVWSEGVGCGSGADQGVWANIYR